MAPQSPVSSKLCLRPPGRRGYALLLVLAVLAMAAVVGVGLARQAMARSAEASEAVERLQLKWGWISAKQTLLPRADPLIAAVPPASGVRAEPPRDLRVTVRLGGLEFALVIADEQAKLNPNLLLQAAGQARAPGAIRDAIAGSGLASRVRLPDTDSSPWPIGSYGQVLPGVAGRLLVQSPTGAAAVRDLVTCYGSGLVNLKRAPEPVLRAMVGEQVGRAEIDGLLKARRKTPDADRDRLLADAGWALASDDVRELLVDRSTCHSLWGTIRGPRRTWIRLAALSLGTEPGLDRWYADEW